VVILVPGAPARSLSPSAARRLLQVIAKEAFDARRADSSDLRRWTCWPLSHRRLRHGLRTGRQQHCGPSGLKLAIRPFRGNAQPGSLVLARGSAPSRRHVRSLPQSRRRRGTSRRRAAGENLQLTSMATKRRTSTTALNEPACWSWEVDDRSLQEAARYSDPNWSSDPRARVRACELVLADWQRWRCAICARTPFARGPNAAARRARQLVIDHDHVSGLIRGILCAGCNHAEGRSSTKAPRYVGYRNRPPAAILGMQVPYFSTFQSSTSRDLVERFRRINEQVTRSRAALDSQTIAIVDELLNIAGMSLGVLREPR
jgi:hypothetical protein